MRTLLFSASAAVTRWKQHQHRFTPKVVGCCLFAFWILWVWAWHSRPLQHAAYTSKDDDTPLVRNYIEYGRGDGGRWYIPHEWLSLEERLFQPYPDAAHYMDIHNPRSPLEAAQLALELCMRSGFYLQNSKIPLIVHQTWKNSDSRTWNQLARDGAERWLQLATGVTYPDLPKMIYIFWDDKAVEDLVALYEMQLWQVFGEIPQPVEKADIFRVAVLKWFGGVYADMDAVPLQHPYLWVKSEDLEMWRDQSTDQEYHLYEPMKKSYEAPEWSPPRPFLWPDNIMPASYKAAMELYRPVSINVGAIFGIEADTPFGTNDHWRAGYKFSVQITNWALAMAPHHPIAGHYIEQVVADIQSNISRIDKVDPLDLTGPPALTTTVKGWSEYENPSFVWESVSGLKDGPGGRGKIVAGDILVLPITGFSPGRGTFHNMGSQPIDHPNARLSHVAQGSWRHTNARVEAGKFCRTFLGGCRDWSKVP